MADEDPLAAAARPAVDVDVALDDLARSTRASRRCGPGGAAPTPRRASGGARLRRRLPLGRQLLRRGGARREALRVPTTSLRSALSSSSRSGCCESRSAATPAVQTAAASSGAEVDAAAAATRARRWCSPTCSSRPPSSSVSRLNPSRFSASLSRVNFRSAAVGSPAVVVGERGEDAAARVTGSDCERIQAARRRRRAS